MRRDFTYVDDVIEGVVRVGEKKQANTAYKIYNIGNNTPVGLMDL
jgi:UDP-glucuronate 4-epimerase